MSEIIELLPMQWRFVQEYLKDLNGKQAAIRAGYSPGTATSQASRLLSNVNVQTALAQEQRKAADRVHVDQDRVLREYMRIAFADMDMFATWNDDEVSLRDSTEIPPALRAAVSEVQQTANGVRIKLHSKIQALDALAKHLGLFREEEDPAGRTLDHAERVARINELLAKAGANGAFVPVEGTEGPRGEQKNR